LGAKLAVCGALLLLVLLVYRCGQAIAQETEKRSAFTSETSFWLREHLARRAGEQQKLQKITKTIALTRRARLLTLCVARATAFSMAPKKRPPRAAPPSAKRAKATAPVVTMPPGFHDEWRLIKELRKDRTAVVDTMGCERLADPRASEKDRRYHVLVSLMLSSQTKDTVNAAVMGALKARGLSVKRILDETSEDEFHELIKPVGFHNVKTKNIRRATQILRDEYDEDVPNTMEELLALPGVGPKMALLVLKCAFDITAGISVDTHVHRISNQLGWTGGAPTLDKNSFACKEPEKTRKALEQWVPRDDWGDVNWLLVGLGQEVQTEKPKLLRKALASSDPAYAVAFLGRIGMDTAKVAKAEGLELVT
jgi:endonuclease-3